jgi:hypothetical protein
MHLFGISRAFGSFSAFRYIETKLRDDTISPLVLLLFTLVHVLLTTVLDCRRLVASFVRDVFIFGARTPEYDNDDTPDRGSRIR